MDSKMIDKEFEKWLEVYKKEQGFIDEYDYPYKHDLRNTWNGCAELMQGKIKELEAEIEKLKERCEQQIWNLGGVSTLLLGYSIDEFNKEYALPALLDTNEFVKKYQHLQSKLDEAVEIIKGFCDESFDEHPNCKYQRAEQFLAKLDLLEGEK